MTTTAARYRTLTDRFAAVAARLDRADWDAASPCEGWTARDVVAHVIATQRDFLEGRGIDLGAGPDVGAAPDGAWGTHTAVVAARLEDPAVADAPYEGMFGPSTVGETLLAFYGFDMVVHRWDVAAAAGQPAAFDEDEMDALDGSIAAFGEHLYGEGICEAPVEVAADASRQVRLLAALGRAPR